MTCAGSIPALSAKEVIMKTIMPRTKRNLDKLEKLDTIYMVGIWARAGVREFWNSGKVNKDGIPLVYNYDDHNGTADQYELVPITWTTTGTILCWTTSKTYAQYLADAVNAYDKDIYEHILEATHKD